MKMEIEWDRFKDALHRLPETDDGKEDLLKQIELTAKEINKVEFRLERALKDKINLLRLLARTSEDLERSTELIKKMFGRYLSTEVMNSLLDDPTALELGGERRTVTIMMTDLRGFTALSERLKPEQVVQMLNLYFDVMVDVILEHHGTINEIIGDALLVVFGAPKEMPDQAQRAIACAIEMQNAMARVNEQNVSEGFPELEMGIGLNQAEVVVGNIGSSKRSKYAVVGSGVNMAGRIESYTVGGQILISESVLEAAGDILHIVDQREVFPKGSETHLKLYEIVGIAGRYNLALVPRQADLVRLERRIPITYAILEGKDVVESSFQGTIIRLSKNSADVEVEYPIEALSNLKLRLRNVHGRLATVDFYAKVIERPDKKGPVQLIRFTSTPPEVDAYFQAHLHHVTQDL
jgi:adenylate cyclase